MRDHAGPVALRDLIDHYLAYGLQNVPLADDWRSVASRRYGNIPGDYRTHQSSGLQASLFNFFCDRCQRKDGASYPGLDEVFGNGV